MAVGKARTDWWIRCNVPTATPRRWCPVVAEAPHLKKDQVDSLIAEVKRAADIEGVFVDVDSISAERAYGRSASETLAARRV